MWQSSCFLVPSKKKMKLKMNTGKSKVIVFERKEIEVVDFTMPYRVGVPTVGCEVVLGGERMEERI